jgi:hypothetical protein
VAEPTAATPAPADATQPIDTVARMPAAERGFLFDSALTVPVGKVEVGARCCPDAGVIDLAVGITPTTELSLQGGVFGLATSFSTQLKQVLVHNGRFRIAALASVRRLTPFEFARPNIVMVTGTDIRPYDPTIDLISAGAVATGCFDARCRVMATGGGEAMVVRSTGLVAPVGWAQVSIGVPRLRAIGEVIVVGPTGAAGNGGTAWLAGARGGWRTVSLEAAVVVVPGDYAGAEPMVLPYAGIAGRI